jgi:hypothetical protein
LKKELSVKVQERQESPQLTGFIVDEERRRRKNLYFKNCPPRLSNEIRPRGEPRSLLVSHPDFPDGGYPFST